MKSASRLGICGDGTTTSKRSIVARNSVFYFESSRSRLFQILCMFIFVVLIFQRDPFPDDFTNEITGRKLKSLPVEKNRAIGFEMFMDRSLFDN